MPTFPASQPVPVVVDVPFANLHVVAGDRDDVVVTVLPTDPSKSGSVRAAQDVRVDRDGDAVTILYPGSWKQFVLPFAAGTADITVELPAGSDLRGKAGTLYTEGSLGDVDMTLSVADVRLEDVDRLALKASAGSVVVGRVAGAADVKVSAGSVRISEIAGDGTIKASNGTTTVGAVTGTLAVQGAHGEIAVARVLGTLTAKSAHGGIRVDRLESGSVTLSTSFGSIDVGVPEGTAAFLDASSEHGSVRNHLTPTEGPVENEATAEIHASTGFGDVVVRRP
ncbi:MULTISPECIES: DUF4097 family beta strand repeat-containing protein [Cellulosimicrobium]|uniref:DUF4097 family beta strand repeat-containing protein n=1 Tax=Cellulosimicrobium sp. ES-005 TaxID=3163031 RepID=A0AAU8G3Y3_9MICO|nr:DUF4097 family beta strand repeat-containing protein [Cellulosimicrobium cellulans]MCO7274617.1 DUF4097 domain-containing protein [Cellulosimicrobium cellulans]